MTWREAHPHDQQKLSSLNSPSRSACFTRHRRLSWYEPERAFETLPQLLGQRADRQRLLKLLDCVLTKQNLQQLNPSLEQITMLENIRGSLGQTEPAGLPSPRRARSNRRAIPRQIRGGNRYGISHERHL
jgi:hypothetical protein